MTLRRIASVVLSIAVGAAACGESEPVELAGAYTLASVEGRSPPQLVGATTECDVNLVGGRILFGPNELGLEDGQFDLGLDLETDCSRGGGGTSEETVGYTGTVAVDNRDVTFQAANAGGPLSFEGRVAPGGELSVTVPGLVPVGDVAVAFAVD